MTVNLLNRFKLPMILTFSVLLIGTVGYHLISGQSYMDCLYMTAITITTIGYGEVISTPSARPFTIFIAFAGIAVATYFLSSLTAVFVEGDLRQTFKRKKMKHKIQGLENHYILCGAGKVGSHILQELHRTKRDFVVIDKSNTVITELIEKSSDILSLHGDANLEEVLLEAGIMKAQGVFITSGNDNQNLVITLTAKYLNPNVRIITRCIEASNLAKIKRAGADSVIAENKIAGMRMASEMIRPTVVSFLDHMLADKEKNLRVEEVELSPRYYGKAIEELNLNEYENTLLMAIAKGEEWTYNPKDSDIVPENCKLIVITNPGERLKLKKELSDSLP